MDGLSDTAGLVALAGAAVALLALAWAVALTVQVRRLRADQRAVLGPDGERPRDLVAHAAQLDGAFRELRDHVELVHRHIDDRLGEAETRLDGAIAHCGLVRFDAYNEMSGRQSTSIALLDAHGSGVVVSSIHHRDQARVYAKSLVGGRGELELAPEEEEAVRVALAGEPAPTPGP